MYVRLLRRKTRPWHKIANKEDSVLAPFTVCGLTITEFHAPVEYNAEPFLGEEFCERCK